MLSNYVATTSLDFDIKLYITHRLHEQVAQSIPETHYQRLRELIKEIEVALEDHTTPEYNHTSRALGVGSSRAHPRYFV